MVLFCWITAHVKHIPYHTNNTVIHKQIILTCSHASICSCVPGNEHGADINALWLCGNSVALFASAVLIASKQIILSCSHSAICSPIPCVPDGEHGADFALWLCGDSVALSASTALIASCRRVGWCWMVMVGWMESLFLCGVSGSSWLCHPSRMAVGLWAS